MGLASRSDSVVNIAAHVHFRFDAALTTHPRTTSPDGCLGAADAAALRPGNDARRARYSEGHLAYAYLNTCLEHIISIAIFMQVIYAMLSLTLECLFLDITQHSYSRATQYS